MLGNPARFPSYTIQSSENISGLARILRRRSRAYYVSCRRPESIFQMSTNDGSAAELLWLGLDLSTQSLTGAVLQGNGTGMKYNEPVILERISYEVS